MATKTMSADFSYGLGWVHEKQSRRCCERKTLFVVMRETVQIALVTQVDDALADQIQMRTV